MGQIFLVRHGQASFGSADYDQLSALGFEQSRLLGQWLAQTLANSLANSPTDSGQGLQRVINGGMLRHRQSADTCMAEVPKALLTDAEWRTDAGFAEFDHHQVLLRQCPALADPAAFKRLLAQQDTERPERAAVAIFRAAMARWMGGADDHDYDEPWPAFRARCVAALRRLIDGDGDGDGEGPGPGCSTIVFTSGGVIATLVQHVLGLRDSQLPDLTGTLANAAVTRLLYRPGQISLSYLNNFAHLEWLGQPGAVTYR